MADNVQMTQATTVGLFLPGYKSVVVAHCAAREPSHGVTNRWYTEFHSLVGVYVPPSIQVEGPGVESSVSEAP